eukprot:TRINITY_DN2070_c0_g1_i1.p1 TRINITY_DN2070_c0_g1~~TRINITY_DN2070_c0_g1_i1.p1  ORF type:complete len:438 (+),score=136.17 TRINITY_DN2070_c0_g1_i1:333-1646(+)
MDVSSRAVPERRLAVARVGEDLPPQAAARLRRRQELEPGGPPHAQPLPPPLAGRSPPPPLCWNTADDPKASFQDGGLPCVPCPVDVKHYLHPYIPWVDANVSVATEWCKIDALEDTMTVDHAVRLMRTAVSKQRFFYLGVGLHKPHMPWQASAEDFDKHPLESVDLPLHPLPPTDMPGVAFHFTDTEGRASPWTPIGGDDARKARRAYRAAVTGMDRKLGRLLDELDSLSVAGSTAVLLHADHGWQLGEHGEWRKMTNFELATRVPLIVRVPWLGNAPARSSALVELVDVLPTVADLAGIALPNETFDGTSFVPVLAGAAEQTKDAAFSQYPRRVKDKAEPWKSNSIIHDDRTHFTHMGLSVRTAEWRYTEWLMWNQTALKPVWGDVYARELYDHRNESGYPTDFNAGENANVAADPQFASVVADLSQRVHALFSAL